MIFIFTITIIGPIETGKLNPKKETVFCTLFCLMSFFFFIVITKRKKKIYNNNHKKESWGRGEREREKKTQEYYDWQTITTQHKYLLTARNEKVQK